MPYLKRDAQVQHGRALVPAGENKKKGMGRSLTYQLDVYSVHCVQKPGENTALEKIR